MKGDSVPAVERSTPGEAENTRAGHPYTTKFRCRGAMWCATQGLRGYYLISLCIVGTGDLARRASLDPDDENYFLC